jgi:NitT/TauT family transport system permease protein
MDLGALFNLRYRHKLRHVILPAIFPAIVAGSIEAIGGGWNATIVSESIMYKGVTFSPEAGGLGYLLSSATASGNGVMIGVSVLTMITIIILTDKILWTRAVRKASKYSFSE